MKCTHQVNYKQNTEENAFVNMYWIFCSVILENI